MKFYTAQFSQVRYLEPNMIPFSTAAGEPGWFHASNDRNYTFIDKRGVINGLIAKPLLLDTKEADKLFTTGNGCSKNCRFMNLVPHCPFMDMYLNQLRKLDFTKVIGWFDQQCKHIKEQLRFNGEPIVILLVYENAAVNCAERPVIQQYFRENNVEVKEFTKDLFTKYALFC